jgi:hypothetical protein
MLRKHPLSVLLVPAVLLVVASVYLIIHNRAPTEAKSLILAEVHSQELGMAFESRNRLFLADINGDGKQNLILDPTRIYELKDGACVLSDLRMNPPGTENCNIISVGDLDGNGRADVLLEDDQVFLLEWDAGEFSVKWSGSPPIEFLSPSRSTIIIADIDEDGRGELAVGGYVSRSGMPLQTMLIGTFEWDGEGFDLRHAVDTGYMGYTCDLAYGDFDNDAAAELVAGRFGLEGDLSGIHAFRYRDGFATQKALYKPPSDTFPMIHGLVGIADLDHDGANELVVYSWKISGKVDLRSGRVTESKTARLFSVTLHRGGLTHVPMNIESDTELLYAGDLPGIGRDIILTVSHEGVLRVYRRGHGQVQ